MLRLRIRSSECRSTRKTQNQRNQNAKNGCSYPLLPRTFSAVCSHLFFRCYPTQPFAFQGLGDPTKIKARQFSRGGSTTSRSAPNNLWTETPEQRQQRIADEVAGKKRRAANAEDDAVDDRDIQRKRQRDEELRKVIDGHNVRIHIASPFSISLTD